MKHLKKIASLALALVMMMALAVPAFAAKEDFDKFNITIDSETLADGHSFQLYAIFYGKPIEKAALNTNEQFQLDTVEWSDFFKANKTNQGFVVDALTAAGADVSGLTADTNGLYDAQAVAEVLSKVMDRSASAEKFAASLGGIWAAAAPCWLR